MEADGNLKHEELDFFLKGNISLEKSARQKPFAWLPDQGWEDVQKLISVAPDVLSSLADDIHRNELEWKEVCPITFNNTAAICITKFSQCSSIFTFYAIE